LGTWVLVATNTKEAPGTFGAVMPVIGSSTVFPTVTVPVGLTRNSDVPLELAMSNSGAVELAEPTIESKAKGVVVLIPMLPEL
jgi:hypothetical protein